MIEHDAEMSCDEPTLAIWDYLDGETDEKLTARVRRHLEICKRCRERFAFERTFLDSLGRLGDERRDVTPLRTRILRALTDRGFRPPPKG